MKITKTSLVSLRGRRYVGRSNPFKKIASSLSLLAMTGLVILFATLFFTPFYFTLPPAYADDWPQVQHDPQHTGYSPETLGTNFRVAWTYPFQPERIHPQVQAIIYQGMVIVPTESGNIYALDAVNPEAGSNPAKGHVIWKTKVTGPVVSSAAADDSKIYISTLQGFIYALNSNNGDVIWQKQLSVDRGFSASPLIAEGKIFIGGRDNYFYGLSSADGATLWQYNVGKPILMTAAYNNSKVFFGAMDMKVYALNTSPANPSDPGTILSWRSRQLEGTAFKDFWPVVTQGKVIVRPMAAVTGIDIGTNFNSIPSSSYTAVAAGNALQIPSFLTIQNDALSSQINHKNLFIFDEVTGVEINAPQSTYQTHSGTTSPPCVDKENYLIEPLVFSGGSGWGRMNLNYQANNPRFVDILFDNVFTGNLYYQGFGNSDENYAVSCSSNLILARHPNDDGGCGGAACEGAFNLDNRNWTILSQGRRNNQMGHNIQGGGTNPMSISNGRVYYLVFHELIVRTTN